MLAGSIAPLTAGQAVASWRADPVGIVLAVLLAAGYLAGVRRLTSTGIPWPIGRTLVFLLGGVGSLLLTTCSFLDVYAPQLRWVAVIQAGLLLLVCPLLIALGSPVALITALRDRRAEVGAAETAELPAAPTSSAGPLPRPLLAVLRILNAPGVGPLVMILVLSLLVFTPWLGWAQEGTGRHALTVVALLAAGLPLALPIADRGAELSSLAYAAMLGLALVEFLLDAVPGLVLRLNTHVVADGHWLGLHPAWGPSPLTDQHLTGDWLWFFAEAGDLPFLIILVVAWIRSDAREAADQDAELDRREQELELPGQPGMMRPWWQTSGDEPGAGRRPG
jgi:putative membrane protein